MTTTRPLKLAYEHMGEVEGGVRRRGQGGEYVVQHVHRTALQLGYKTLATHAQAGCKVSM
jgi:hypothetical protein